MMVLCPEDERFMTVGFTFFGLRFLTPNLMWQLHPFSLSEAPDGRSLRISIKISGDFTRTISTITPGTRVLAEGPFGHLTDAVRQRDCVALIAGGIGVTPMRALLEEMPGDVVLIYRAAHEEEILFRDEFDALAHDRGVRVHFVTGDHKAPGNERLMTTEHLRLPNTHLFGPLVPLGELLLALGFFAGAALWLVGSASGLVGGELDLCRGTATPSAGCVDWSRSE